jgi:hypothetical protein
MSDSNRDNNNNININKNIKNNAATRNVGTKSPKSKRANTMFATPIFKENFVDVVGVDSELNGRSCSAHPCCGHTIVVGDKLVCTWGVAVAPKRWQLKTTLKKSPEEEIEEHVKVHKLDSNGLATCHVGYLTKRLFKQYPAPSFDLMFLRVKTDFRVSDNQHERSRSGRFLGIVLCEVIRDNPRYNGHNPFDNDPLRCFCKQYIR